MRPNKLALVAVLPLLLASSASGQGKKPGGKPDKSGPDKVACANAHGESQVLRQQDKLREAKEQLAICADDACPQVLRRECSQWLGEVSQSLPSVLFIVQDEAGKDLIDVKVSVDGEVVTKQIDGKPVAVNPGIHTFRYEGNGAVLEERLPIRVGEANRRVTVKLVPEKKAPPPASAPPPPPPAETTSEGGSKVPVATWVLGGVGVVALGAFAYFGLSSQSKLSDLDSRGCKPHCPQDDVDAVKRGWLFANISLGVGVVSLGAATVLYLTRPTGEASARLPFDVVPLAQGGAMMSYGKSF